MKHITSKMVKLGVIAVFAVVCAVGLMSGSAWALVIGAAANTNAQLAQSVCPAGGVPPAVALDLSPAAGAQCELAFATPAGVITRVVIRFNAECSIAGGTATWLDTNIVVDPFGAAPPIIVTPSNGDNALCTGNGTAALDGWVSAVTQVVVNLPGGVHTVWVNVTPVPAAAWRIDDLSLVVER